MKIAVVGAGYVGLVTAACFSEFGFTVTCIDHDAQRVAGLQRGIVPIHETGLAAMLRENQQAGRFHVAADLNGAVAEADVVMIAVSTPARRGEGDADLTFVHKAAGEIAAALEGYTLIVTKSTVPVGTTRVLAERIRALRPDADFDMASNPEFLREGSAIKDFMKPDRIVVGVESERAREVMKQLYRPVTLNDVPIVFTGFESAELIKYAANGYLAMRLAFVNELADLSERTGADIGVVTKGIGHDHRIGQHYLRPGPGFGGSCFPKDTSALAAIAREAGAPFSLIEAVVAANERRKHTLFDRIAAILGGVEGKRIAVLGIAFKAETDDVRDSPALTLIPALQAGGATIAAYDPAARARLDGVAWCADAYEAARDADAAVIVTEWNEFRGLDLSRLAAAMRQPVMIDLRNLYAPHDIARSAFAYHSLGRAAVMPRSDAP